MNKRTLAKLKIGIIIGILPIYALVSWIVIRYFHESDSLDEKTSLYHSMFLDLFPSLDYITMLSVLFSFIAIVLLTHARPIHNKYLATVKYSVFSLCVVNLFYTFWGAF